ncbi:MFS transporter MCT family solute carrier family 16 (monocarboxylic acid transporters) member 10 [Microdochium nivale]|nr:MFS transporter MCT family solute carrier family 16 (monocarboxylic acid transporters) member 10 [Microdochium nivale]
MHTALDPGPDPDPVPLSSLSSSDPPKQHHLDDSDTRGALVNPSPPSAQDGSDTIAATPDQGPDSIVPPDGGYGWVVVAVCFVTTFWLNAWTGSWGVIQAALLATTLHGESSSTVSFVGALGFALSTGMSIFVIRTAGSWGARWATLVGVVLTGVSNIVSAEAVSSVPGLFITCGLMYGVGSSLIYTLSSSLPIQWFSTRLGTANGIIKLGGGVGATIMSVITGILTERLGVAWTLRMFGIATLATAGPLSFFIRERDAHARRNFFVDWTLFQDSNFVCLVIAGVIGTLSIYMPPFFLPSIAASLGFGPIGVIACFNACMAVGRVGSGFACDALGATNVFLLTMSLNGVTMLCIWTFSSTAPALYVFAALNGLANGAFFVSQPTAVARLAGGRRGAGAVAIALTGWAPGLLVGTPIAGFLIDARGAAGAGSIVPYRPAVYYGGGTALLSALFVMVARLRIDRDLRKKM